MTSGNVKLRLIPSQFTHESLVFLILTAISSGIAREWAQGGDLLKILFVLYSI